MTLGAWFLIPEDYASTAKGADPAPLAQPLALPAIPELSAPVAGAITRHDDDSAATASPERWRSRTIQPGDSLAGIFNDYGLSSSLLHRIVNSSDDASSLSKIRPGQEIRLQFNDEQGFQALMHVRSDGSSLQIFEADGSFHSAIVPYTPPLRLAEIIPDPAPEAPSISATVPAPGAEAEAPAQVARLSSGPPTISSRRADESPQAASAPAPRQAQTTGTPGSPAQPASAPTTLSSSGPTPQPPEQPATDIPSLAGAPAVTPAPAPLDTTPSEPIAAAPLWREHLVRTGDTLAEIFAELGISSTVLHHLVTSSEEAGTLARIRPGQTLRFRFDADGRLAELIHERDAIRSLRVAATVDGFAAELREKPVERRMRLVSGTIESSLFKDGQRAGLGDAKIMELADIFAWDIDFALEIRAGDRFSVAYEQLYVDGENTGTGPILAAEFVNQGVSHRALRYTDAKDMVAYFDPDGHSLKSRFMRTPVKFSRVSSGFTKRRWHPVLKRWRSHKGVDYAAPTGTPVRATGEGRVSKREYQNGYGNVVFVQHGSKYTTVYAHLSRFRSGVTTGSTVQQGDVIGYVGKTGLATGPHLHYEFRVNGVHTNPLTVKLPQSYQLPKREMQRFRKATAPLLVKLDEAAAQTMLAEVR